MADPDIERTRRFDGLKRADEVDQGSLIGVWFGLGVGFAENVVRVSNTVVVETTREVGDRTRATLTWIEGFPRAGFSIARTLIDAGDVLFRDAVARVERGTLTAVGTVDRAGDDVRQVTGRAVARVVGPADGETAQA